MFLVVAADAAALTPSSLRCEYRVDPLGIQAERPRLSWTLSSPVRGQFQSGYQILVASSLEKLLAGEADLWNRGKVGSRQTAQVPYDGRPLPPGAMAFWKVRVWDKDGKPSPWSAPAHWSMGLLKESDWQARWIGWRPQQGAQDPLPIFRKEFRIERNLKRATVHVCGLGFFELRLNGRKVGDHVLDPGWTNYRKTALYVTHDVTSHVRSGGNAIGVMLGNGMYNVPGGRYVKFKGSFGPPKLILQLRLEFADGSSQLVVSDTSWKAAPGPIVFSCIYGGEDHDARREQPGWDAPGFDDSVWAAALVMEGPGGRLIGQSAPPVMEMRAFRPVRVTEPRPGIRVFDLGQNFSGWPVLSVRGAAGSSVKMIPGELLDPQGFVSQRSSGGPSFFTYTLKSGAPETWHPRFTYYGFRYVQVETRASPDGQPPAVLDLTAQFVYSSATPAGEFTSSNQLLNRIHDLIQFAIRSNLQSVLTDCPHREKLGWLEVAHLLGPSILFGYQAPALYAKILQDMSEAQTSEGLVPNIAPEYTVFQGQWAMFRDSPEWGSASVVIPWLLHRWYGDTRVLREHYPMMKRYVDYLSSRAQGNIVSHGLGDWYDIGPRRPGVSQLTPAGVTATAIYYQDLRILTDTAALLGERGEAARYGLLSEAVRRSFNQRFYDQATGQYGGGSQTANAMPLVTGIAPPALRSAVLNKIVAEVRARANHTSAGDVGYRYVIRALTDGRRSDVVFDMATRTDAPSYGYQLEQGATSLTEAWDANPRASQNHCMLGHLEEWFYLGAAGIDQDSSGNAFEKIVIRPQPAGDLTWVKAHYDSIRGRIASEWKIENGVFLLWLQIPANTTARVFVPGPATGVKESGTPASRAEGVKLLGEEDGSTVLEVGSGEYRFSAPLPPGGRTPAPERGR